MLLKYFLLYIILLIFLFIFSKCYPTYQASKVDTHTLKGGTYSNIQAKVFKSDNSIILFPRGYFIDENFIRGEGIVEDNNTFQQKWKTINLPLDSITAMTTYEETTSDTRNFGSFFLGLTGPPLTFLGIYCISCPKCCFGSCPTVYVYDGKNYNLEAELFSECISKQLENSDIDLLKEKVTEDTLKLKITNEALETHYINKFEIVFAEHPTGTKLFPSIDHRFLLISKPEQPFTAITKDGANITDLLKQDDNKYFRSGVKKVSELKSGPVFDWIDIKIPASKNSDSKLILKYRNTLLSTTLLYNVVLASQGAAGLNWTKKMNEDAVYASQFKTVYDEFSGIKIKIFNNGSWNNVGKFKDAGPLNWKYIEAKLPVFNSDTLLLRLEFIPDNFMIDYIAVDTSTSPQDYIKTEITYPCEIKDGRGTPMDSLFKYIKKGDLNYLKTEPGDSYYLNYNVPKKNNCEETALVYSKGYYNEWIRGSWINDKDPRYTFNLYDIQGTLSYLADSWNEDSKLLEKEFFHSRFSLEEVK